MVVGLKFSREDRFSQPLKMDWGTAVIQSGKVKDSRVSLDKNMPDPISGTSVLSANSIFLSLLDEKHRFPMEITDAGIEISCRLHTENAALPIVCNLSGRVIAVILLQLLNACLPIVIRVAGRSIELIEQFSKALSSIVTSDADILKVTSSLQKAKADSPIVVTQSGTITSFRDWQ